MEKKGLRKGFCKIPNFIAWSDLSGTALKLYVFLASLSPKFRTIRNYKLKKLGMALNTLQRAKNELVKRNVLFIHKRQGGANFYALKTPNPDQFLGRESTQFRTFESTQDLRTIVRTSYKTINNKDKDKLKNKFKGFKKL
jgi:hypothetical protein